MTAVRAAVLPPCAAKAMAAPPQPSPGSCSQGDKAWQLARYASKAATGTRMNVCNAFQIRSKAGILSAKNSIPNNAPLIADHPPTDSTSRPGGKARIRRVPQQPERRHRGVEV